MNIIAPIQDWLDGKNFHREVLTIFLIVTSTHHQYILVLMEQNDLYTKCAKLNKDMMRLLKHHKAPCWKAGHMNILETRYKVGKDRKRHSEFSSSSTQWLKPNQKPKTKV